MPIKKYDEKFIEEIRAEIKKGNILKDLCVKHKLNYSTIYDRVSKRDKKYNILPIKNRLQIEGLIEDTELLDTVIQLLYKGFNYRYILEKYGYSKHLFDKSLINYIGKIEYKKIWNKYNNYERIKFTKQFEIHEFNKLVKKLKLRLQDIYPPLTVKEYFINNITKKQVMRIKKDIGKMPLNKICLNYNISKQLLKRLIHNKFK
jgi:hypothetical protein